METQNLIEAAILAVILFGCVVYIKRNLQKMFSLEQNRNHCGHCSNQGDCAQKETSQTQEECPP